MRTLTKRQAASNLTFDQEVVTDFSGLDSLPGFVLVIFERRDLGGAVFSRLVNSGERFRSRFSIARRDLWKKYFAVAVNDSVLSYAFTRSITLDDGSAEFALTFQLTFRVVDPRKVAETRQYDPLRKLCDEIGRVIVRNCARRKAEMFRERFRELERIVIDGESARLRDYASALGLKIISIDLDRPLPEPRRGVIKTREAAEGDIPNYETQQSLSRTKETVFQASQPENSEGAQAFDDNQPSIELDGQIESEPRENTGRHREQTSELSEIGQAMKNGGDAPPAAIDFREGDEIAAALTQDFGNGERSFPDVSSSNQGIESAAQWKGWTDGAAVLIDLLNQARADASTVTSLQTALEEIGLRVFSLHDPGDPEVSKCSAEINANSHD